MGKTVIRVKVDMHLLRAVVRRVHLDDEGRVESKEGLSTSGEWIVVPEGQRYPDECQITVLDQTPRTGPHEWDQDMFPVTTLEMLYAIQAIQEDRH